MKLDTKQWLLIALAGVAMAMLTAAFIVPLFQHDPAAYETECCAEEVQNILDQMLADVRDQARAYTEARKALDNLVKPAQLQSDSYVEENFVVMQDLLPLLQARIESILSIFEETGHRLGEMAQSENGETISPAAEKKWEALQSGIVASYRQYFALEQRSLDTTSKLLTFYYSRLGSFSYDAGSDSIIFNNPEDAAQAAEFRAALEETAQAQRDVLKNL